MRPAGPYMCVDDEPTDAPGGSPARFSMVYPECHNVPISQIGACCRMATGYHKDDDVVDEETICQRVDQMDPDTLKKYSGHQFCVS